RQHYWRYRMPCTVETLLTKATLINRIHGKIEDSGRLKNH
ncbi:MAG: 4-alpha-glucanotransferase, partial [Streblomastix strix]